MRVIMSKLLPLLLVLAGCAPVFAQTQKPLSESEWRVVQLQQRLDEMQRKLDQLEAILQTRPDRLEVHGDSDAMLNLIQKRTPGGDVHETEGALLTQSQDRDGRQMKIGSLSWRLSNDSPVNGYAVGRLNSVYLDPSSATRSDRSPGRDDLAFIWWGAHGACFYCADDEATSAPGWHRVSFVRADVVLNVVNEYVRFIDQNGWPFYVKVQR